MLRTEYQKRAAILAYRAAHLEAAGRTEKALEANIELMELDFETFPELAGEPSFEASDAPLRAVA